MIISIDFKLTTEAICVFLPLTIERKKDKKERRARRKRRKEKKERERKKERKKERKGKREKEEEGTDRYLNTYAVKIARKKVGETDRSGVVCTSGERGSQILFCLILQIWIFV